MSATPRDVVPRAELERALAACQYPALYQLPALQHATRRMLSALDHYWAAYENDELWERAWWSAFERLRKQVEELARG